jgi:ComF family protein
LQEAIHQLKYANLSAVARPLGETLADFWQGNPLPADLLVPVPLHPRRERERGYNQASLLAKALGEAIGLPVLEHAMVRVRETRPQVGLNSEERRENVRGAFHCESTHLAGRHVALIDDVCTTGATLEACSLALRQAGAASIWALTLARPRL